MMINKITRAGHVFRNIFDDIRDIPVIILLYHRVAELVDDPQGLAVTPDNFREQLLVLRSRFPILRFEEDWNIRRKTSFIITFDDGYADNLYHALPVLEELGIPATFFVSSAAIGNNDEFWWDKLENIIYSADIERFPKQIKLPNGNILSAYCDKKELLLKLQLALKPFDVNLRNGFIDNLILETNCDYRPRKTHLPLTLDELRQLASSSLVTIGSHTVNHVQLSGLPGRAQKQEISKGHKELEIMLNKQLNVFSYPFGNVDDFNAETVDMCRENGFSKVAANFPGQAHTWTDPMLIPRQIVRNWNKKEFTSKIFRFKYL
jgi:peptidoglycan/xylan/chitin deacetylase (PgdA/CDA1 family)